MMKGSSLKVLFVCVENAGRSQMAEAIARAYGIDASSAGTVPAPFVNPTVVQVMRERGFSAPSKPKLLTAELIQGADYVVTMGCSVQSVCPAPMIAQMEKKLVDWHIDDPKGKPVEQVRAIMSQIENKVLEHQKKN
jgi:protein-tyrosine-phosphatase